MWVAWDNMRINPKNEANHNDYVIEINTVRTVLIVGETGTGKSIFALNIYGPLKLVFYPHELGFLILDMTRVEFIDWEYDSYLISPVIYQPKDAFEAFEMALNSLDKNKLTVIHIEECDMVIENQKRFEELWKKASESINVLVVFSTSRPSKDVLTDQILRMTDLKVVFKLSTAEQSKRVLGFEGAEKLDLKEKIIISKNSLVRVGSLKLPVKSKTFSDLHIKPDIKIEVLPTDLLLQTTDVLEPGDRLVGVFRGVGGSFVAKSLQDEFTDSFSRHVEQDGLSIEKALQEVVDNMSLVCLYEAKNRDFDTVKHEGAMLLVAYISPDQILHFIQVGNIAMKQKVNGKFVAVTQNHTFDNPEELNEIVTRKLHSEYLGGHTVNDHLNFIALKCFDLPDPDNRLGKGLLLSGIPSRFISHADYCGILKDEDTWLINTKPYIGKIENLST